MNDTLIKIDIDANYPSGHPQFKMMGFVYSVKAKDAKKLAKLLIECINLNGGNGKFIKEEILIIDEIQRQTTYKYPFTAYVIISHVFNGMHDAKDKISKAHEIWRQINTQ